MTGPLHDDEADTSESTTRALLEDQYPHLVGRSLEVVGGSGTDNVMWRVRVPDGDDLVVRLPRTAAAARGIEKEHRVLSQLARSPIVEHVNVPSIRHAGLPAAGYPHRWTVQSWIEGRDAWAMRNESAVRGPAFAETIAQTVSAIGRLDLRGLVDRQAGDRGGPLADLLDRLDQWLTDPQWHAADLVDVDAIKRIAAESREVAGERVERRVVHGDLIPGNILLSDDRLSAVIDWSGAAMADPAQDLAPAWSILDASDRQTFRIAVGVDDATWLRGRAFELEHTVGAILYYRPRRHPLADVMQRSLDRILDR